MEASADLPIRASEFIKHDEEWWGREFRVGEGMFSGCCGVIRGCIRGCYERSRDDHGS